MLKNDYRRCKEGSQRIPAHTQKSVWPHLKEANRRMMLRLPLFILHGWRFPRTTPLCQSRPQTSAPRTRYCSACACLTLATRSASDAGATGACRKSGLSPFKAATAASSARGESAHRLSHSKVCPSSRGAVPMRILGNCSRSACRVASSSAEGIANSRTCSVVATVRA